MTVTRQDLFLVWQPLAASLGILLIGAGSAMQSLDDKQQAQERLAQAQQAHRQIEQTIRQESGDAARREQGKAIYQTLSKAGAIGAEKRLEWMELLNEVERIHDIPQITYEFSPRQRLGHSGADASIFFSSQQRIKLRLRHEGEFLSILAKLRSSAQALLIIRSCRLSRSPGNGDHLLSAECELDWVTLPENSKSS